MIRIENTYVTGFDAAIRGMRNPMNSWDKMDSWYGCRQGDYGRTDYDSCNERCKNDCEFCIGVNDLELMKKLVNAGTDHSKFMRMINIYCDIVAPMYWWKEFDTYKIGTVRNSCSTMHKIHSKEFTIDDFSYEHLTASSMDVLTQYIISVLNLNRNLFLETKDKSCWWQMIQLLPSSYNQRATIQLNYAVLKNIYHARKNHKLDEWRDFCNWIESLPYAKELIIGE